KAGGTGSPPVAGPQRIANLAPISGGGEAGCMRKSSEQRVPITDVYSFGLAVGAHDDAVAEAIRALYGVEVERDWMDRWSVSATDAYAIRDQAKAAEAELAQRAGARRSEEARLLDAQRARNAYFTGNRMRVGRAVQRSGGFEATSTSEMRQRTFTALA